MMDNCDQPNSILHVNPLQMYPIPGCNKANGAEVPFPLLAGEGVVHCGHSIYGKLVLTNYRLFLQMCDNQHHIPVGLIETVEHRELFFLHVGCKDARTYRLTFDNNETCLEWFNHLLKASMPPAHLEELFAFFYFVWTKNEEKKLLQEVPCKRMETQRMLAYDEMAFNSEVERLKFNLHGTWRISSINKNYKLCPSYPPQLLVPAYITDEVLETVAKFRSSRRIPAVVWRHTGNGAVIARCSQPEVGWLGWRSSEDEELIKAISEACTQDRGPKAFYVSHSAGSSISANAANDCDDSNAAIAAANVTKAADLVVESAEQSSASAADKKKVLIMDARSYTTAVANRARGGGCECPEYYPRCEIQFMNLANIHTIRKSFHSLRQLCTTSADQPNWFALLDGTRWLQHMSGLMKSALTLVTAIERDARPILVHCSDGWDRTPQIVALAQLLLDPYYRTIDGFRILVEREWLAFGHKFADRCGQATGSEDPNERCPVFLQWLDCVHQLLMQYNCAFEFNHTYLVKLAQHTYSNLFGTFLCNTKQERELFYEMTFSVWQFLEKSAFRNKLYSPQADRRVLWPQCNVRDLRLWSEVYLGSLEAATNDRWDRTNATVTASATTAPAEFQGGEATPANGSSGSNGKGQTKMMCKTRSYGDLPHEKEDCSGANTESAGAAVGSVGMGNRRSSDPNISNSDSISKHGQKEEEHYEANGSLSDNDCKSDCMYYNGGRERNGNLDYDTEDGGSVVEEEAKKMVMMSGGGGAGGAGKTDDLLDAKKLLQLREPDELLFSVHLDSEGEDFEDGLHSAASKNNKLLNCCDVADDAATAAAVAAAAASAAADKKSDCSSTNLSALRMSDNLLRLAVDDNSVETSTDTIVSDTFYNSIGTVCAEPETRKTKAAGGASSDPIPINGPPKSRANIHHHHHPHLQQQPQHQHHHNQQQQQQQQQRLCKLCTHKAASSAKSPPLPPPASMQSAPSSSYCCVDDMLMQQVTMEDAALGGGGSSSTKTRKSSPLPLSVSSYSRTPSANGWDSTFLYCTAGDDIPSSKRPDGPAFVLDDDGLVPLRSDVQEQLGVIMEEHKKKVEALQRELHTYRKALIKQVCQKCNHNELANLEKNFDETNSVVESVCSVGEGQASAVESLRSDMSWEAVEEGNPLTDGIPNGTLWVPDHAVTRCTGCNTVFWLGRRKHHCRNCGRIFCADCSENSTPLPSEHLYDPVRVCSSCFSKLSRSDGGGSDSSDAAVNNNSLASPARFGGCCKHEDCSADATAGAALMSGSGERQHQQQQQQQQQPRQIAASSN